MIAKMQGRDFQSSFGATELPEWYQSANEPKSKAGKHKGLSIILDAHTNIIAGGTVSEDIQVQISLARDTVVAHLGR